MKIVFSILLLIHGIIHLIGFRKGLRPDTSGNASKKIFLLEGLGWLLCAVLFFVSSGLLISGSLNWWMIGLPAMLISQVLIIKSWHEARFGTLVNGLILLAALLNFGNWNFNRNIQKQYHVLQAKPYTATSPSLTPLEELPLAVQKWLHRSGSVEPLSAMYVRQSGEMRTAPESKWLPVKARQWYRLDEPGFLWSANVRLAPGILLKGRDVYDNGHGYMLIKAAGLVTVADAEGPETDQGTLLRFLGEMVWYPWVARSPYLSWKELDSQHVVATMNWQGTTASGIFRFHANGDVASFEADRYYENNGTRSLQKWHVSCDSSSFREFSGLRIPTRAEVTWKLKTGDFTWFRLNILEMERSPRLDRLPTP